MRYKKMPLSLLLPLVALLVLLLFDLPNRLPEPPAAQHAKAPYVVPALPEPSVGLNVDTLSRLFGAEAAASDIDTKQPKRPELTVYAIATDDSGYYVALRTQKAPVVLRLGDEWQEHVVINITANELVIQPAASLDTSFTYQLFGSAP